MAGNYFNLLFEGFLLFLFPPTSKHSRHPTSTSPTKDHGNTALPFFLHEFQIKSTSTFQVLHEYLPTIVTYFYPPQHLVSLHFERSSIHLSPAFEMAKKLTKARPEYQQIPSKPGMLRRLGGSLKKALSKKHHVCQPGSYTPHCFQPQQHLTCRHSPKFREAPVF